MLINLTNHPSTGWSKEQLEAAARFGKCVDMPFPAIDPDGDERYIDELANQYLQEILAMAKDVRSPVLVHLMGEMNFTFALVSKLKKEAIACVASTSERKVLELGNGQKEVSFRFVRFRHYESVFRKIAPYSPSSPNGQIEAAAPVQAKISLTSSQQQVFDSFVRFIDDPDKRVFILNGYAGTGKTTLVRFFIEELERREKLAEAEMGVETEKKTHLLASTGRAAKVLSNTTGYGASTVHSCIYSFLDFNQSLEEIVRQEDAHGVDHTGLLYLYFPLRPIRAGVPHIYIIDEASMIGDEKSKKPIQAFFGTGKVLNDLFEFDPMGKYIFVGDECQLPPVGQDFSPALSSSYFQQKYHVDAEVATLTQIVRQQADNSIIQASKQIRELYANPPAVRWGKLPLSQSQHIKHHSDLTSMMNLYLSQIADQDYTRSCFISSSNAKCKRLNNLLRPALGFFKMVEVGDLLLVTQNNLLSGLMNGDLVVVEQVKDVIYQQAQLSFQPVEVRELVTGRVYSQLLLLDMLSSNASFTNLNHSQQKGLFVDFYRRMKARGMTQGSEEFNLMLQQDEYLNALRCVYGYALTCHKAQGGEWDQVFVDIPRKLMFEPKPSAYQWIYTAITRAKEQLHIVKDFYIS